MLERYREAVEARLRTILPEEEMPPLSAAMRYSLLAGGKRLRPCMLLAAVAMLGEDWHGALERFARHGQRYAAPWQADQPCGFWRGTGCACGRWIAELRL